MKINLLSLALLIVLSFAFLPVSAQVKLGGNYGFKVSMPQDYSNIQLKSGAGSPNIKKGYKINVVHVDSNEVVFKYWSWSDDILLNAKYYGTADAPYLYSMAINDFEKLTRPVYNRFKGFEIGAYTVPYRLRGLYQRNVTFDFESSLSLQANFIFGWGSRYQAQSQYDVSFGLGLTKIELSPINSGINVERTASALTFSLGGVWKPTPVANVGIFLGWDWLGAKDQNVNWHHDGRVWMGIGINVSFNALQAADNAGKSGEN
jgi:hypothetical protein